MQDTESMQKLKVMKPISPSEIVWKLWWKGLVRKRKTIFHKVSNFQGLRAERLRKVRSAAEVFASRGETSPEEPRYRGERKTVQHKSVSMYPSDTSRQRRDTFGSSPNVEWKAGQEARVRLTHTSSL